MFDFLPEYFCKTNVYIIIASADFFLCASSFNCESVLNYMFCTKNNLCIINKFLRKIKNSFVLFLLNSNVFSFLIIIRYAEKRWLCWCGPEKIYYIIDLPSKKKNERRRKTNNRIKVIFFFFCKMWRRIFQNGLLRFCMRVYTNLTDVICVSFIFPFISGNAFKKKTNKNITDGDDIHRSTIFLCICYYVVVLDFWYCF